MYKFCVGALHIHDFRHWYYGAVFVDGRHEYLRRGYKNSPEEGYVELSEWE